MIDLFALLSHITRFAESFGKTVVYGIRDGSAKTLWADEKTIPGVGVLRISFRRVK